MSVAVARGHGGNGGGDDPSCPPPRPIGNGCRGVGGLKATRETGGRDGGSKGTHKETRNLGLKKVMDEYGPLKIQFEFNDKGTMLHLVENSARWSNLVGELVREYPDVLPFLAQNRGGEESGGLGTAHGQSQPPANVLQVQWDKQIDYWLDPKHAARAGQNAQNWAKSKVFCRHGSRSLAVLRDQQMESSAT
ncbi:hypothetical protein Tco_1472201, partial [Tanacetum coccineum]